MDNPEIIIIIDNNATNGAYLSTFCREQAPRADVSWLLICDHEPTLSPELEHSVTYSLDAAAQFIDEKVGGGRDVVVFYNPQLGMLQRNVATAVDSHVTQALHRLVQDGRRVLVNVHSTDMPTRRIAEFIDPSFDTSPLQSKVISHHLITGAAPQSVREVVQETLNEWKRRFAQPGGEE